MFTRVKESDIKDKFLSLIKENGTTTTMEVKKALRKDGFWIFQSTVSLYLNDNFESLGCVRTTNGEYYTYELVKDSKEDSDIDINTDCKDVCDGNCTGCNGCGNKDEDIDDAQVGDFYAYGQKQYYGSCNGCTVIKDGGDCTNCGSYNDTKKRAKIVNEPIKIEDDIYFMKISLNNVETTLVISKDDDLDEVGTLVYEVRSRDGNDIWYLYSSDKDIITRHRAIYYVWKVINNIVSDIKYKELRSTKRF